MDSTRRPGSDPLGDTLDEALGDALSRLSAVVRPHRIVAGWATVELDRAEIEVAALLAELGPPTIEAAPDEPILGARCRLLRFGSGRDVLILEPSTEGRLAGALARHGEGTLVRYLVAEHGASALARAARFQLTTAEPGPLGSERLVLDAPRQGPFSVIVEG